MLQILEKPVSGIYFHTIWWHALIWVKKIIISGKGVGINVQKRNRSTTEGAKSWRMRLQTGW
jgi:hypothetical protein